MCCIPSGNGKNKERYTDKVGLYMKSNVDLFIWLYRQELIGNLTALHSFCRRCGSICTLCLKPNLANTMSKGNHNTNLLASI